MVSPPTQNSDNKGEVTKCNSPLLYTEIFESYCPVLMAMGMTYNDYWNGDNDAPRYYFQANRLKKKQANEKLWLQGMYIYDTLCRVAPLFSLSPSKPMEYMSEPYPFDEQSLQEYEEVRETRHYEQNKDNFMQFMKQFNAQRGDTDGN